MAFIFNITSAFSGMAMLLTSSTAATDFAENVNDIEPFWLDQSAICTSPDSLSNGHDPHYSELARTMKAYAEEASAPYLAYLDQSEQIIALLEHQDPNILAYDKDKQTIMAKWFVDSEQTKLHRTDGPALIKIDLAARSYIELWLQNGAFDRGNDLPTYTRITPTQISQQWANDVGLHHETGPAHIEYRLTENELELSWYLNDLSASINDGPTFAQINLDTNIAYFQEWAERHSMEDRVMHRPSDHLHTLHRDRVTGITTSRLYRYHSAAADSDEWTKELTYDPITGIFITENWMMNGQPIAPPDTFTPPEHH